MRESIVKSIKSWDYKSQKYKDISIPFYLSLIEQGKPTKKVKLNLETLNLSYIYENKTLHDLIVFCLLVEQADLSYPIIISNEGEIIDGRHRVAKAIIQGYKTIDAIMFIDEVNTQ